MGDLGMAINFYPNREQLSKEIDQCVASRNREVLLSFCRCCIYNIFEESTIVTECFKCGIQHGLSKISNVLTGTDTPDIELLGVC
jgi:hypothetical protein